MSTCFSSFAQNVCFLLFYDYVVMSVLYLHGVKYAQIFDTERATQFKTLEIAE